MSRVTMAEWAHRVFGTPLADAQKSEQCVVALTRERRERQMTELVTSFIAAESKAGRDVIFKHNGGDK